jgi:hypothetical protein
MVEFKVMVGSSIDSTIRKMIAMAVATGDLVQAEFNGVGLIAEPGMDPNLLMQFWQSEMDRAAATYRESPAGIKAAADAEARRASEQATADRLMAELPTLDFSDVAAVIDWMEAIADPSDHVGVFMFTEAIIGAFNARGFVADVNVGEDFDGEDSDNFARYLIGQGLSNLSTVGAIHSIFHKFAADWRSKFVGVSS